MNKSVCRTSMRTWVRIPRAYIETGHHDLSICDLSAPTGRWEVKERECLEIYDPHNLLYAGEGQDRDPVSKQGGKWKPTPKFVPWPTYTLWHVHTTFTQMNFNTYTKKIISQYREMLGRGKDCDRLAHVTRHSFMVIIVVHEHALTIPPLEFS